MEDGKNEPEAMVDDMTGAMEVDWLGMVRSATTPEKWGRIIAAALEKAMQGDRYATEFIASCVLPKERTAAGTGVAKEIRLVLRKETE